METLSYYCIKLTERKSFAWRYFGVLVKAEDYEQCVDSDHIYCSECFQANLSNDPTSIANIVTVVKRYKRNVSTGNLLLHLKKDHHKSVENGTCNKVNGTQKQSHKRKPKNTICRDLALWFCQDLLPFHLTSSQGFAEFAKKHRIGGGSDLPETKSVLNCALSDIYETALSVVMKEVQNSPPVVTITMDTWSDMLKQLSYVTFTLHFVSKSFVTKTLTLRTCILPHPYVVEDIHNEIKKTVEQFNLKSKTIICITPEGINIFKACTLNKIDCYTCVSHGLHNLIISDGLKDTPEVKRIVINARKIMRHLGFRMNDLPQEYQVQNREILHKLMQINELLDEDARLPLVFQQMPSQQMTTVSNCAYECPTRWTCILPLLEILVQNETAIVSWLNSLDICELVPNDKEWSLMNEVSEVLGALQTASEVLSGCRFPSLNLALLFRAEVLCSLQPDLVECQIVRDFKRNMLRAAEMRFPVSELQLCATLLDPSLHCLQVTDEYLCQNNSGRECFLKKMYESYISEEFEESLCQSPIVSSSGERPAAWKTIKLELLQKHTGTHRLGIEAEIQQYLSVSSAVEEDPLMWWKDHQSSFPRLACLAKCILGIPATNVPSERAFNAADILWNAKRMALPPALLDKMLFIHENHNDTLHNVMFSK